MSKEFESYLNKIMKSADTTYNKKQMDVALEELVAYIPVVTKMHRTMYDSFIVQGYSQDQALQAATDLTVQFTGVGK